MINSILFKIITFLSKIIDNIRATHYRSLVCSTGKIAIGSYANIINTQGNPNRIVIGEGSVIDGILQVFPNGNGIEIGKHSYVGLNSRIWASNQITIGDNVLISHNVNIIDSDSHEINYLEREKSSILQLTKGILPKKSSVKTAPITIKDNAWISYNVSILKGVTIGKGAIIGCGAVVTHNIPDFCLAVGNPATVIKQL